MQRSRPLGVTLLSILSFLAAIWFAIVGIGLIVVGSISESDAMLVGPITEASFTGSFAVIFGVVFLGLAVFNLFLAVGYWTLQGWARTIGLVIQGLALIAGLVAVLGGRPASLVEIVVAAVIFVYLLTPGVKAAFGHGAATA